jgi:hypothetical protein
LASRDFPEMKVSLDLRSILKEMKQDLYVEQVSFPSQLFPSK